MMRLNGADLRPPQSNVILHYHLFKNAGTSIDQILRRGFGDRWGAFEGPDAASALSGDQLLDHLSAHPMLRAVSSHHLRLPLPRHADFRFFPILFLRHPIDRVGSVYRFEQREGQTFGDAATPAQRVAAERSMGDWVRWYLDRESNRVICNFHVVRFHPVEVAAGRAAELRAVDDSALATATAVLHDLPTFGLVEDFDESIRRLAAWLRGPFPELRFRSVRANATQQAGSGLEERVSGIRRELGPALYDRLVEANAYDIVFYARARALFDERAGVDPAEFARSAADLAQPAADLVRPTADLAQPAAALARPAADVARPAAAAAGPVQATRSPALHLAS